MKEKKLYEEAEIEVIKLAAYDIMTASGGGAGKNEDIDEDDIDNGAWL